jgi:hypothetical protein
LNLLDLQCFTSTLSNHGPQEVEAAMSERDAQADEAARLAELEVDLRGQLDALLAALLPPSAAAGREADDAGSLRTRVGAARREATRLRGAEGVCREALESGLAAARAEVAAAGVRAESLQAAQAELERRLAAQVPCVCSLSLSLSLYIYIYIYIYSVVTVCARDGNGRIAFPPCPL